MTPNTLLLIYAIGALLTWPLAQALTSSGHPLNVRAWRRLHPGWLLLCLAVWPLVWLLTLLMQLVLGRSLWTDKGDLPCCGNDGADPNDEQP